MKIKSLLPYFSFLLLVCSLWTLVQGEVPWSMVWPDVLHYFSGPIKNWNPLLDERLPRLIVVICTGASLAVSGAVMQSLFHNPLASPSVLGISSGGCLCGIVVFLFDWHFFYPYALPLAAFLGCLGTLCLVYALSGLQNGKALLNLILTGIAISTIFIAIQSFLLYALRDRWQLIQTILEWEAGSTLDRNWQHVHMQLPLTLVGLGGCWKYRHELDLMALGEEEACNLGVDVQQVRWRLFLCVSLLTGGALAALGVVSFFGLVFPHLIRRLQGPNHLTLIPSCIVGGAATLLAFDLSLRIFGIYSLSIGNLSALIGGFAFLCFLFQRQRLAPA